MESLKHDGQYTCKRVDCDEIWSFRFPKTRDDLDENQRTFDYCDVWTWTARDADTRLVPSWLVGERTTSDCYTFLADLRSRLLPGQRIQLTTDSFDGYPPVIDALWRGYIDHVERTNEYAHAPAEDPCPNFTATCAIADTNLMSGLPDPEHTSLSYVERQNLTMRMGMRRFTHLTDGFAKKVEHLAHAVSLHYMHYNFARPHPSLADARGRHITPAVAAGVAGNAWSTAKIARLLD